MIRLFSSSFILILSLNFISDLLFSFAWAVPVRLSGEDLMSGSKVEISLKELKANQKAKVVVFLSVRCPCSRSHEEVLKKLAQEYLPPEFEFIGVHSNSDEEPELARTYFRDIALPFKVINDPLSEIADAFEAYKTPHVYVIGKGGEILFAGGVDDSANASRAKNHYLSDVLSATKMGKPIPKKQRRVLGCIINRP